MKYDKIFLEYIDEVINNKEFLKRKKFMHHVNESVYDHSMKVAYESYKFAKKHHLNVKNICIGAILHDFYFNHGKKIILKRNLENCMDLSMLDKLYIMLESIFHI